MQKFHFHFSLSFSSSAFHRFRQNDETSNTTSDEETSSRRSVRFNEEMSGGEGEGQNDSNATDEEGNKKSDNKLTDYVTHMSLKRHTSLFHNALRRKCCATGVII